MYTNIQYITHKKGVTKYNKVQKYTYAQLHIDDFGLILFPMFGNGTLKNYTSFLRFTVVVFDLWF